MQERQNGSMFCMLKGTGTALICALISILVFAFVAKTASLNSNVIKAVNQFLKILSVFMGCITAVRGGKGLVKGALIGLLFTVLIYLIFALIGGGKILSINFFIDLVFGLLIGAISGIITAK